MSLKAFIDSTWFKGLARAAMILGAVVGGYAGVVLASINGSVGSVRSDVEQLEGNVRTFRSMLDVRVREEDEFQKRVDVELKGVATDVQTVKVDIATIKGILSQMNRREVRSGLLVTE